MAINMVTEPGYGYYLVALCGVSPSIAVPAESQGVQVVYSASGVLGIKSKDGTKTFGVIPMKGSTITLLKEGKLGPASKESLKYQIEKCLSDAISDSETTVKPVGEQVAMDHVHDFSQAAFDVVAQTLKGEPISSLVDAKGAPLDEVLGNSIEGPVVFSPGLSTKAKIHLAALATHEKVALVDATELGQPVTGTSVGSTYYMVALFTGLKLAIRHQGETLSIRVEGSVAQYKDQLVSFGFMVKPAYASIHLTVPDALTLKKVFGAVIGVLGFSNLMSVIDPTAVGGV